MGGGGLLIAPLDVEECWARLRSATLGRVAISVGALPVILPVFFTVVDRSVVFRSTPGTKLAAATSGMVVAFEADGFQPTEQEGWSVLIQGVSRGVDEPAQLAELRTLSLPHVGGYRQDGFVSITASRITGRVIRPAADPSALPEAPPAPAAAVQT